MLGEPHSHRPRAFWGGLTCCVQVSAISCERDENDGDKTLALDETLNCAGHYIVTQGDIDSGFVSKAENFLMVRLNYGLPQLASRVLNTLVRFPVFEVAVDRG